MAVQNLSLDSLKNISFYTQKAGTDISIPDSLHLSLTTPPSDEYRRERMVTEDELMFLDNAVKETGIKDYSWSLLKDNHSAIKKSQTHLIDLIRYYEGDSNHYYESVSVAYKDKGGHKTIGFGEWLKKGKTAATTQNKAYRTLSEHIQEHAKYLKNKVGQKAYDSMPQSIKEALIDLSFNKGPDKIGKIIKTAVAQKNWSEVIANIHCLTMNGQAEEEPGLYRRSLSRAILAVRDLSGKEKKEAGKKIEELYQEAVKCFDKNKKDKTELNKIYEQYSTGKISGEPESAESGKIKVDNNFKGLGLFAVAKKAYESLPDKQGVEFKTFFEEFKRINMYPETIVLGSELNVPYLKNIVGAEVPVQTETTSADISDIKPAVEENEKAPVKKKGFWARAWDGIKNFFKSIGNFFKNLFGFGKDKEDTVCEKEKSVFEKMVETGNITQEGPLQVISVDYKIKKGDTLWTLSREYSTSEEIICNDNNIADKDKIKEGQIIKIQKLGYKVQKGDNLFQISKKFGLSVEILKDLNNIEDVDKISENQMLEIPGFLYEVQPKDTLTKISKAVGVCVKDLMALNNLTSDVIHPGQKIIVVYNDSDYAVTEDKKEVIVDKETNTKTEIVNLGSNQKLAKRPLLQKKMKVNGKVVATRKVFAPTKAGKLSGKTIIVNAGHGYSQAGTDIGTPGLKGLDDEWLLNYDNAMKLKDKLCAEGASVIFLQGKRRLITEEIMKSDNKADMFISVHVNSATKNVKDRTQIYYRQSGVSGAPKRNSIKLANIMEKNFDKWIPENESISSNEKFIYENKQDYAQSSVNDNRTGLLKAPLNHQKIPGVIWEVAFMSTAKGRERLSSPELMSDYADIMTQSVIEYFG